MRKGILIIILLLSANNLFAHKHDAATVTIKTNIYCDHCSQCESCGIMLGKELNYIKGVKLATIDEKAMTFTIKYNPDKTTPEKIRIAISKLGYDADDVKADPTAYQKLDGCCKKPE